MDQVGVSLLSLFFLGNLFWTPTFWPKSPRSWTGILLALVVYLNIETYNSDGFPSKLRKSQDGGQKCYPSLLCVREAVIANHMLVAFSGNFCEATTGVRRTLSWIEREIRHTAKVNTLRTWKELAANLRVSFSMSVLFQSAPPGKSNIFQQLFFWAGPRGLSRKQPHNFHSVLSQQILFQRKAKKVQPSLFAGNTRSTSHFNFLWESHRHLQALTLCLHGRMDQEVRESLWVRRAESQTDFGEISHNSN